MARGTVGVEPTPVVLVPEARAAAVSWEDPAEGELAPPAAPGVVASALGTGWKRATDSAEGNSEEGIISVGGSKREIRLQQPRAGRRRPGQIG